ncbi:ParB/RepB/Spo0J family partition protein [Streptomyces coacervatus]|nr:ParB/RepB/Spo0J family partition protein [Streptomyces coacervatus]MDF2265064.1 ParB/RepB/Spo0J family partition protein [Streptomyces coacervatus]
MSLLYAESREHENNGKVADVVAVPIALLLPGESPRLEGQDREHVARLAEIETPLPAVLVNRGTMQVIDGMHRILAALSRGQETIDVQFFDGTAEDAFLRAVEANVTHGLPLSLVERRAAAARIIQSHPHMSDRAIARAAGLGAKAVAAVRRRSSDATPQLNARIGRDGKVRPLNSVEGRRRAADVLAERPQASLREVARLAGISPATVSDVRRRLVSGESPLPAALSAAEDSEDAGPSPEHARARGAVQVRLGQPNPDSVLEKLLRDPSLRHKQDGRQLLRLLQQNAIGMRACSELAAVVPPHCGELVVHLARQYAETWRGFAQELDERVQSATRGPVSG